VGFSNEMRYTQKHAKDTDPKLGNRWVFSIRPVLVARHAMGIMLGSPSPVSLGAHARGGGGFIFAMFTASSRLVTLGAVVSKTIRKNFLCEVHGL
jgi:hypothetical protein